MKKLLKPLLVALCISLSIYLWSARQDNKYYNAFESTCKVTASNGGSGTGVLLSTGHVLSVAHILNVLDGIDYKERQFVCTFYNRYGLQNIPATLAYISSNNDFSILKLNNIPNRARYELKEQKVSFGENVFSVGCPLGRPPILSEGKICWPLDKPQGITTAYCMPGNSGGGMFRNQDLLGIVKSVPIYFTRSHGNVFIPMSEDAILEVDITVPINIPLFGVSYYVPAYEIIKELDNKGLDNLYKNTIESSSKYFILPILQLILLLLFVVYVFK